jgi:hypothetical protein
MAETVTFWLDNKVSSGVKVAEIGGQVLVSYREKFYVVEGGAARMKGSRPLHYSKSSLPSVWKKALRGIVPPVTPSNSPEDDIMPMMTTTKKERAKMEKPVLTVADQAETQPREDQPRQVSPKQSVPKLETRVPKAIRKSEVKPDVQARVVAVCPYCNHKNELPFEKGKNGKPFFTACGKCSHEFAVRFVPVTVYQAQVAAFK